MPAIPKNAIWLTEPQRPFSKYYSVVWNLRCLEWFFELYMNSIFLSGWKSKMATAAGQSSTWEDWEHMGKIL
jgi:hypothetical protein